MADSPSFANRDTHIPEHLEVIVLGMGCFWGAQKRLAAIIGVIETEVGYSNGEMLRADYKKVLIAEKAIKAGLSRIRNHAEVVKVTYDPSQVDLESILKVFWEGHNPTQMNRQGNDIGSNYRSGIYYLSREQAMIAEKSMQHYQTALRANRYGKITTEILPLKNYNRAEEEHQDYLKKHPDGYCGLGGVQVKYHRD